MGKIEGTAAADIDAPVQRCYEIAADVEQWGEWQRGVQRIEVLDRDGDGRVARARIINQTKVREITTELRFSYQPPRGLSWTQTAGDLKRFDGSWAFEEAGYGRTRARYQLQGDPGRMIGLLLRGAVEERVRELLVQARPGELKVRAETG
jgi:ribosome-associated toxin RatA of RatAB toxin-antitoxin module